MITKINCFIILLFSVTCWQMGGDAAAGEIYAFTDKYGRTYYTNVGTNFINDESKEDDYIEPTYVKLPEKYNAALNGFEKIIIKTGKEHKLDPALIKAIIHAESGGKVNAYSAKGAIGLMQLMPETALDLRVNPYDPSGNIKGGVKYLRSLLEKFNGDLILALAAYNAGPGVVKKYKGIPPYPETRRYIRKVLNLWLKYSDNS